MGAFEYSGTLWTAHCSIGNLKLKFSLKLGRGQGGPCALLIGETKLDGQMSVERLSRSEGKKTMKMLKTQTRGRSILNAK